jgi:hypothetical protein
MRWMWRKASDVLVWTGERLIDAGQWCLEQARKGRDGGDQ